MSDEKKALPAYTQGKFRAAFKCTSSNFDAVFYFGKHKFNVRVRPRYMLKPGISGNYLSSPMDFECQNGWVYVMCNFVMPEGIDMVELRPYGVIFTNYLKAPRTFKCDYVRLSIDRLEKPNTIMFTNKKEAPQEEGR